MAAATTSTRRASRFWCTRLAPTSSSREVEAEYARRPQASTEVEQRELQRIAAYFAPPPLEKLPRWSPGFEEAKLTVPSFARWAKNNLGPHRADGYTIVNISLKPDGGIPGDATSGQMRLMADLAERYSFDELRVSHAQNIVLPHVKKDDVFAIWQALEASRSRRCQLRSRRRHHRLPGPRLLRARNRPLDPHRPVDLAQVRGLGQAGRDRQAQDQYLGLHQCLRPPSCRPHRHPRPR